MFREYEGLLDLKDVIKDKYGYGFDKDNIEDFYEQDFVSIEGNGVSAMCWIDIDNDKYLFKPMEDFKVNVLGELLSEKIAKKLGIPCAEYRACVLGNQGGVLTKNFVKDNDTMILGCEVFQQFFNQYPLKRDDCVSVLDDETFVDNYAVPKDFKNLNLYDQQRYLFSHLNNLEEVWSILSDLDNKDIESNKNVVSALKNMLLFDLITLQGDRHVNNWAIIKKDDGSYGPCPLFDNAISMGVGYFNMRDRLSNFRNEDFLSRKGMSNNINKMLYQSKPHFTLSEDNNLDPLHKIKDSNLVVFNDYLEKSDESFREEAIEMISMINGDVTDSMLDEIEEENGFIVNSEVRGYIDRVMDIHNDNLLQIAEKYKSSEVRNDGEKSSRRI